MLLPIFCSTNTTPEGRRTYFHKRKLEMLRVYKDSLERRLSALLATIDTLEQQIARDQNLS